jgi:hypothetical protein
MKKAFFFWLLYFFFDRLFLFSGGGVSSSGIPIRGMRCKKEKPADTLAAPKTLAIDTRLSTLFK